MFGAKKPVTPPAQVIEELTAAIADLKDELENAKEAKRFAQENLKSQMIANETLEEEIKRSRNELIELLARQQAEMPVMTAPSPNGGTTKIMIDEDHFVTVVEGEGVIRSLTDRVKVLEKEAIGFADLIAKQREESESLREINGKNMTKMKQILAERTHPRRSDEKEIEEMREQIASLEAQLTVSREIADQVDAIEREIKARDARIEELESEAKKKAEKQNLLVIQTDPEEMERLQTELEQEKQLCKSLSEELDLQRKENEETVAKLQHQDTLIDSLQTSLAVMPDVGLLRQSLEDNENQVIELVGQVSELKRKLENARSESRVQEEERISKSADSLSQALKAAQYWKAKYLSDMRSANARLQSSVVDIKTLLL
jgi:chromosome segregation ATPase